MHGDKRHAGGHTQAPAQNKSINELRTHGEDVGWQLLFAKSP